MVITPKKDDKETKGTVTMRRCGFTLSLDAENAGTWVRPNDEVNADVPSFRHVPSKANFADGGSGGLKVHLPRMPTPPPPRIRCS